MKYYQFLSRLKFLNKYSYKFLFVSFLGIHVPLIGLILFIALSPADSLTPGVIIGTTLVLTLAATGATLYILHQLITPIRVVQSALHDYLTRQQLPNLPIQYRDEVGVLMQDVQRTINEINYLLEEKKDLLAILSHDLRSPIITIQQAISMVKEESDTQIIEKYYQIIEKASDQQLDLIKTITSFWEQESNSGQLYQSQSIEVDALIREVLQEQELKLKQKGLSVQTKVAAGQYAAAEPKLLSQVLNNLVYNAIKFSKPGGIIYIETAKTQDCIQISIQDQGIGFDQANAEALFQRFTPFRKKGTCGEDTNGLGLYLCRKMLQKQAGTLTAYSPGEEKGAIFTLTLKALNKTEPVQNKELAATEN